MEYQDLNDYELLSYVSENIEEANDIIMKNIIHWLLLLVIK